MEVGLDPGSEGGVGRTLEVRAPGRLRKDLGEPDNPLFTTSPNKDTERLEVGETKGQVEGRPHDFLGTTPPVPWHRVSRDPREIRQAKFRLRSYSERALEKKEFRQLQRIHIWMWTPVVVPCFSRQWLQSYEVLPR